jgi:non-specific serine/threonine protein kinase
LGWFWQFRRHYAEARDWLLKLLAADKNAAVDVRAKALNHAVGILFAIDDESMKTFAAQALALIPVVANVKTKAWLFYSGGIVENLQSSRRRELLQEALTLFHQIEDTWGTNEMILLLGQNAFQSGEFARAFPLLEEGTKLARQMGDKRLLAVYILLTGCAHYYQGIDILRAKLYYQQSLGLFNELEDKYSAQVSRLGLGKVARWEQDNVQAHRLFEENLAFTPDLGNSWLTVSSLIGMGILYCAQGEPRRAARLLGAVEDQVKQFFAGPSYLERDNRMEYEQGLNAACTQLGEEAFAAAFAEGRAMTIQQAVAYALGREYN